MLEWPSSMKAMKRVTGTPGALRIQKDIKEESALRSGIPSMRQQEILSQAEQSLIMLKEAVLFLKKR